MTSRISLASFLPPSNTLRGYQRRMMSTTVAEIGAVYCSIVSFANTQTRYEMDRGTIIQSLIAIRLKLKRSLVLRTNIVYEASRIFSLLYACHPYDIDSSHYEGNGLPKDIRKYWKYSCESSRSPLWNTLRSMPSQQPNRLFALTLNVRCGTSGTSLASSIPTTHKVPRR